MDVVGHQHLRVQGTLVLERRFAKLLAVMQVVSVIGEARLAIIAALHDVLGNTGEVEAGQAGHPWRSTWRSPSVDKRQSAAHRLRRN